MTYDEWITAGRPHWQCAKCKGIFVTVAWPDDFICDLCKNPRLRNLVATDQDKTKGYSEKTGDNKIDGGEFK